MHRRACFDLANTTCAQKWYGTPCTGAKIPIPATPFWLLFHPPSAIETTLTRTNSSHVTRRIQGLGAAEEGFWKGYRLSGARLDQGQLGMDKHATCMEEPRRAMQITPINARLAQPTGRRGRRREARWPRQAGRTRSASAGACRSVNRGRRLKLCEMQSANAYHKQWL
jgi:hypothetical protein